MSVPSPREILTQRVVFALVGGIPAHVVVDGFTESVVELVAQDFRDAGYVVEPHTGHENRSSAGGGYYRRCAGWNVWLA